MSLLKSIQIAFQPAKEITDPKKFSGRRDQVESACHLLLSKDHIFIHGISGIGKSSLARQLLLIAGGDTTLLKEIGSDLAQETFEYSACFLTCDSSVKNINALLYRLLIDPQGLAQWNDLLDLPPVGTFDLDGALNPKLVSEFRARAGKVAEKTQDGLALFIDELDKIEDRVGLASLIRSPPPKCLFVVIGISDSARELVQDHASIGRQLDTGNLLVPNMTEAELRLIVKRAEEELGRAITFEESATARLVHVAQGQPYLLQLVGKFSLNSAYRGQQKTVSAATVDKALQDIVVNRLSQDLEKEYLTAIGSSPLREVVLRVFAEAGPDPLNASEAYRKARQQGVDNPAAYVQHLLKKEFGAKLKRVKESFYQVSDPLFRAYVTATPRRLHPVQDSETPTNVEPAVDGPKPDPRPRSSVNIVHLSDLHYGPTHYFSKLPLANDRIPEADRPTVEKYLVEALQLSPAQPPIDILVVSGDFTQTAQTAEFKLAERSLKKIIGAVNLSEERVVMIPGNHDVSWSIRRSDPNEPALAFGPYMRFRGKFGNKLRANPEPHELYEIHDYIKDLGCVVLGLNSAVMEEQDEHRGYIGETQLQSALTEVEQLCVGQAPIKIAVFHHHIMPVPTVEADQARPEETLRDVAKVKERLWAAGFTVVLHGHRHQGYEEQISDGQQRSLVVIGCGSTGVEVRERGSQRLQFNRIQLQRSDKELTVRVRRVYFDVARTQWIPSEDHHPVFKIPLPAATEADVALQEAAAGAVG